jgi:very-short-patch-repair endonuclease
MHAAAHASSDRAAEWRVAAVVQQRLATATQLIEALDAMPRMRRRALVRAVLADVRDGAQAQSELDLLRLLRRHRLPRPDGLQRLVRASGKRYLDAWWERQRVAVEVDGAHHLDVGQWSHDVLRANAVVVAERHDRVVLLRFTTGNLRHDVSQVVDQLRAVLLP